MIDVRDITYGHTALPGGSPGNLTNKGEITTLPTENKEKSTETRDVVSNPPVENVKLSECPKPITDRAGREKPE